MSSEIVYLIDMSVYSSSVPVGTTHFRFATVGGVYGGNYYEGRLKQPGVYTTSMFLPGTTGGDSQIGFGLMELINSDGTLDSLITYGMDGRTLTPSTWTRTGGVVAGALLTMEQPEFDDDVVTIRIKDPSAWMKGPIQTVKFAGTNAPPLGYEGEEDIKGTPKPICIGLCPNIEPVLVNRYKLIFQIHHQGNGVITDVFDKGVKLVAGTTYSSLTELQNIQPALGYYRVYSGVEGVFFRLGFTPAGKITCTGGDSSTSADLTAAQMAKRLLYRKLSPGSVSTTDIMAMDAANSAIHDGLYIKDETTWQVELDKILSSVGAAWWTDENGVLRMAILTPPTGTPDFEILRNDCLSVKRIASKDENRGVPVSAVNLQYGKNYTVQKSEELSQILPYSDTRTGVLVDTKAVLTNPLTAYGNGMMVAVKKLSGAGGNTDVYITSTNGTDWTQRQLPASRYWRKICFGCGLFILLASGTDRYLYSSDGINWTEGVMSSSQTWIDVAWSEEIGLFVAICRAETAYATSPDGINWTGRTWPSAYNYNYITAGNGLFVHIANSTALVSSNGTSWTAYTTTSVGALPAGIMFGNRKFIIWYNANNNALQWSSDGTIWNINYAPTSGVTINNIVYGAYFVLMTNYLCFISFDGLSWDQIYLPTGMTNLYNTVYGNGVFIVIANTVAKGTLIETIDFKCKWLEREYRKTTIPSAPYVPGISIVTKHALAGEMNVTTLIHSLTDANTEATRKSEIYRVQRDTLEVQLSGSVMRNIQINKVGKLTWDRYGYNSGKLLKVIGVKYDRQVDKLTLTLWGAISE